MILGRSPVTSEISMCPSQSSAGAYLDGRRTLATLRGDGPRCAMRSHRPEMARHPAPPRAWDQALWLYVMLSSGSWHSLVRPQRSHSSVPTRALTRLPRAVAVRDGRFLRPPEGLVLDGHEHGGRLVCVAIDGCCMMPVFVVNR